MMKKFKESYANLQSTQISDGGASHVSNRLDIDVLIKMLKDAFCEEMNAWYQYMIAEPFLVGDERTNILNDYRENAEEELSHGRDLLERINQLGGNFDGIQEPNLWNVVATHKYIVPNGNLVKNSVMQQIAAEQGAIETYTKIEQFTRDCDVVTNQLVKHILADEEKHLQEMIEFNSDLDTCDTNVCCPATTCEPEIPGCEEPETGYSDELPRIEVEF